MDVRAPQRLALIKNLILPVPLTSEDVGGGIKADLAGRPAEGKQ